MDAKDIFIVNYRHSNCEPMKSITLLPKEDALILANKLYTKSPCRAHNRFGSDFEEYYESRVEMEKWLYERFIALGGNPKLKNPFYFSLQYSDDLYDNFNEGSIIKIELKDISILDISFTFGDSMAMFYSSDWKDPFLKNHLYNYIFENDNNADNFLCNIQQQYHYIEVQLWTDEYFDNCIEVATK